MLNGWKAYCSRCYDGEVIMRSGVTVCSKCHANIYIGEGGNINENRRGNN